MSNLVRKKVRYRTKSGKSVLRTMMVKAEQKAGRVKRAISENKGKVALATAATLGAAYLAHRNKAALGKFRRGVGAKLSHHVITEGGSKIVSHLADKIGGGAGGKIGRAIGGRAGETVGSILGEVAADYLGQHYSAPHLERAGKAVAQRMRRK